MDTKLIEKQFVLHTWTAQSDWNAPTIVGGAGAWFWDAEGKRYLDMSSQAECCNLGHQHPSLVKAIQDQAQQLCYISNGWGAQPRAALAQEIVEVANSASNLDDATSFGKVFFTCDGAEAIENAVKIARWVTGRHKVISRYRSYHGATHAALSIGADSRGWNTPEGLTGVTHVLPPYCYRCPFGLLRESCNLRCASHVEEVILYEGPHNVAAIIAEPSAGTNGIIPPPGYWLRLREICSKYGIMLIADEVMSGFGRTGAWFAWQRSGASPDMFTIAKGLTGAYVPLGAVCVTKSVAAYFDHRLLETGLTYSGHPLACAAGLSAIQIYRRDNLIRRAQVLGEMVIESLRKISERHPCIGDIRGDGLFVVIEMQELAFPQPLTWLQNVKKRLLSQGISMAIRGNMIIISPPFVIEDSDLYMALDLLDEALP